jgi:glycerophosphoryl diester phosphodiesterase
VRPTIPFAVAHRLPSDAAACSRLAGLGARGFECDIQLRGADVVVSHYLPFLQLPGWLEHDGRRFRWGGGPPADPTLAEAMARVPGDAFVSLDPKELRARRRRALTAAVVAAVRRGEIDAGRLVVTTHEDDDLADYRAAGIRTWRTAASPSALQRLLAAAAGDDDGAAVRQDLLDERVVAALHRHVRVVVAWPVNDAARARALLAAGVDGITTDREDVLRAVAAG